MNRAFYNGISGTKSHQFGIDTWAHNISNINTNGYKANIPQFAELFSTKQANISEQTPVQSDLGNGSRAHSSAANMDQGTLVKTDKGKDLAIVGEGWFGVQSSDGNKMEYTRNGNFTFNAHGDLVTEDGNYLMGTLNPLLTTKRIEKPVINYEITTLAGQQPLKLPLDLVLDGMPTKNVTITGNLGVEGTTAKYNKKIFNKDGQEELFQIKIEKSINQPATGALWNLVATINDKNGKEVFKSKPAPILFDTEGHVKAFRPPFINNAGVKLNLDIGKGNSGVVAMGGDAFGKSITADGQEKGLVTGYEINETGNIMAQFDNGLASSVGVIPLYHFQNDQGLNKVGDTKYSESPNSGPAFFYLDADNRPTLGSKIAAYTLEKSNTSAAVALTQLIVMQKAFDANAKSITTGDQMIQEALRMV
ncbi:MAG: flagellar hook-basal body complex protein [Thiovulaceae bacterium]|nr:flagellar hook-basal body complex protein [Sulfurimonadaceae bacterium]